MGYLAYLVACSSLPSERSVELIDSGEVRCTGIEGVRALVGLLGALDVVLGCGLGLASPQCKITPVMITASAGQVATP